MSRTRQSKIVPTVLALSVVSAWPAPAQEGEKTVHEVRMPEADIGVQTLESRRKAQLRSVDRFEVVYDFRFEDRRAESGITFVNEVTLDGKRDYKGVHYDHGNGLAVADVDGDGRLDIYFLTQIGRNELWRSLGGGRYEDITDRAGVALGDRISVTASFGDLDNDGDADLYVTTVKMGNVLYENLGGGRFRDVTAASGLGYVGHSSGATLFDYDNDGLLDCFLSNVGTYTTDQKGEGGYYVGVVDGFQGHLHEERTEPSILFRNIGGLRFEDVSEKVGLVDTAWTGDATIADFNEDGFMDLYAANMQGDDHFWVNEGGRRFVDKGAELFPSTPWGTMGLKTFDFDNDRDMDMILSDMHSDMSAEVGPFEEKFKSEIFYEDWYLQGSDNNVFGNAFYRNDGDLRFTEASDALGTENYWPWGLSVGDLNADGWEDVFIASSMNFPWRYGVNTVLLNNRGKHFLDAEFILGIEPRKDGATYKKWDFLHCSGVDKEHEFCEGKEGDYQVFGTLGTRSSAIIDVDADGDLDIVTGEYHSAPQILISDLADTREVHYLEVRLIGRRSNRDGIGAMVTVFAGERAFAKPHDGKSGYLSQSSMPLYFGLGDAERAERIEVRWPSGTVQTVTEGIPANGRIEIEEPAEADAG